MKALKILGLLALTMLCSCDTKYNYPYSNEYWLSFSFQDASGNDLVKGIELSEWFPGNLPVEEANSGIVKDYTLDIIVSEPCTNWDNKIYNAPGCNVNRPGLGWFKLDNGYNALGTGLIIPKTGCPEMKMLTFKLSCPYVFGDDAVHEFVTYWNIKDIKYSEVYATCYKIEFEGKVFTPIILNGAQKGTSIATIILDKKESE